MRTEMCNIWPLAVISHAVPGRARQIRTLHIQIPT